MSKMIFERRMTLAQQAARVERSRKRFRVLVWGAGLSALGLPLVAVSTYFLCFGEELRDLIPAASEARVGCTWADNLIGGYVPARARAAGSTTDRVWTLTDGESVKIVSDPGPTWNPAREVTVIASGSAAPARVRRWNLAPAVKEYPAGADRGPVTLRRDADPLAPSADKEMQRQQEVFLQLR